MAGWSPLTKILLLIAVLAVPYLLWTMSEEPPGVVQARRASPLAATTAAVAAEPAEAVEPRSLPPVIAIAANASCAGVGAQLTIDWGLFTSTVLDHTSVAKIEVPALCLNGTQDELCTKELMDQVLPRLCRTWTMHWIEQADHSLHVPKSSGTNDKQVLSDIGATVEAWIGTLSRAG